MKNNKIFIDELKRTFPVYILGMVFHAIVIYILYKIPSIIGNILDLLMEGNASKETILNEVYSLIFYSIIMIIPRIVYRTLFFTKARISDTYLRSKVIEHLQAVKPEYYDREDKGVFLAYLSKELLLITKFLGNAFFNVARLIVAPIIGLIVIEKNFNIILMLSILPIFPIAIYFLYKLYKKQVVDIDFTKEDIVKTILFFIVIYTSLHLLRLILKYVRDVIINKIICKILRDIRKTLFDKILNFKMMTFNKYNSSELYTRLTSDVDNLFDLFFGFLYNILSNILYIVFMIVMMFVANINLAVIGSITIILISVIVYKFTKVLGKLDDELLKKRDKEHKEYSELHNKSKLTYLFKLQNNNVNKMNDLFYSELKIRKKYIFTQHFPYWIIALIQAIGIYTIIYYALNINVAISLGSIYLVLYYTKECKTPLEEICNQLEEIQTCINSYKRIKVLLNETEEEKIEKGAYIENLKRRY